MSNTVLGISAFYHDSAAAIVCDGEIIAAAQEERFTRKKHDPRFPERAINYCLEEAFIEPNDLDAVVFYDNPLWTWDRALQNSIEAAPAGYEQFEKACRSVLGVKMWVAEHVCRSTGTLGKTDKLLITEHHMSHAASAFYPSPFRQAAILTLDGVGEWATTTIGMGEGERIELLQEIDYPHSLGLLYSAVTYFCGFKVNSGEYKLMGLAPYGRPRYYDSLRRNVIDIREDGSYRLNMEYFGYLDRMVMTSPKFEELCGGPPRQPESGITRREMDLAASVQKLLEEVVLKMARHARALTGCENLTMAGGVALNCVANGKLLRERIFEDLWIQPAAGDAGGALGAALLASHVYFNEPRRMNANRRDTQKGSLLGPAYSSQEVKAFLERHNYPAEHVPDDWERARLVAELLADGKIVGYLHGHMEFGPRSLGARSILGDPRRPDMQSLMNLKIKFRESFRPFAPAVLAGCVGEYFELDRESPYMLLVAPVAEARRKATDMGRFNSGDDDLLAVVNMARSDIPAVTHIDYSARIQSVHPADNPEFARVLEAFREKTGCGVLVNTSFNVRGEPIVCSVRDAYRCFMRTGIDVLVLEDYILYKADQPALQDNGDWRTEFVLD
jgi:carbamoyltransferase